MQLKSTDKLRVMRMPPGTVNEYINAYSVITISNKNSVRFHEKFGFQYLTTYKKIGYKLGQWHDAGWWQYQINNYEPVPLIPFPSVDEV